MTIIIIMAPWEICEYKFNVLPTQRLFKDGDLGLKSHLKDWEIELMVSGLIAQSKYHNATTPLWGNVFVQKLNTNERFLFFDTSQK